jgi:hypothetical protein
LNGQRNRSLLGTQLEPYRLTSKSHSNNNFNTVLCLALLVVLLHLTQGEQGPPPSTGVGLLQLAINSRSWSMADQ